MPKRELDLGYLAQKLDQARSSLVPPHSEGVVDALASSMFMCGIVGDMLELVAASGDPEPSKMARTILEAMNTDGIESDPAGRGTLFVKIQRLSHDDLFLYSRALDTLATWAILRGWGDRAG